MRRTRSMDEFADEFSSHRFPFGYEFHDEGWVGSPHGACYLLALRGWTEPPTAGDRDLSFGYIRGPVWVVKLWSAVSIRADLTLATSMAWSPDDLPEHCLLGDTSAVVGFVGVEHLTVSHVLVGAEVTMVATASVRSPAIC